MKVAENYANVYKMLTIYNYHYGFILTMQNQDLGLG